MSTTNGCLLIGLATEDNILLIDDYPPEDSTIRCDTRFKTRGGNASNSGTVMSLLGMQHLYFMGPLPSKEKSSFILNQLNKYFADRIKTIILNICCNWKGNINGLFNPTQMSMSALAPPSAADRNSLAALIPMEVTYALVLKGIITLTRRSNSVAKVGKVHSGHYNNWYSAGEQ